MYTARPFGGARWRMRNMPVSHDWLIAAVNKSFINITLCQYTHTHTHGHRAGRLSGQKFSQKPRRAKQTRQHFVANTFRLAFPEWSSQWEGAKRNYVNMALMHAIRPPCVYNLISGHARGPTLVAHCGWVSVCVCVCVCVSAFILVLCVKCCANEIPQL